MSVDLPRAVLADECMDLTGPQLSDTSSFARTPGNRLVTPSNDDERGARAPAAGHAIHLIGPLRCPLGLAVPWER